MAASGREYTRIKYGARKLLPVPDLKGGASYWGAGQIYSDGSGGRIPTDIWLEDFMATENPKSLEQLAYGLRRALNGIYGSKSPFLGFQVAGIGNENPQDNQPVFFRICNHDRNGGRRPEFEVERTSKFPHIDQRPIAFADGDEALYAEIQRRIEHGSLKSKLGPIPLPSLGGHADYQAAMVRFVSDLYDSAGLIRTIGGKVTTLSVPYGGEARIEES